MIDLCKRKMVSAYNKRVLPVDLKSLDVPVINLNVKTPNSYGKSAGSLMSLSCIHLVGKVCV